MIKMSEIAQSSVPVFSITMTETKHAMKYMAYMELNKPWLQKFNKIIFCINGNLNTAKLFINDFSKTYPDLDPELVYRENLGHTFGTLDVDFAAWERVKQNPDIEYIWKFAGDTLADASIMDIEVDESCDFFYLNNIGSALSDQYSKEDLLSAILDQTYFYPQTNYYFYKPQSIKRWYPDSNEILKLKQDYENILQNNSELYPWEALQGKNAGFENPKFIKTNRPLEIEGCASEAYLGYTVLANNLKMQQLMSKEDLAKLIDLIYDHGVCDGSHKNFLLTNVGGLCHYHVMNAMAVRV